MVMEEIRDGKEKLGLSESDPLASLQRQILSIFLTHISNSIEHYLVHIGA